MTKEVRSKPPGCSLLIYCTFHTSKIKLVGQKLFWVGIYPQIMTQRVGIATHAITHPLRPKKTKTLSGLEELHSPGSIKAAPAGGGRRMLLILCIDWMFPSQCEWCWIFNLCWWLWSEEGHLSDAVSFIVFTHWSLNTEAEKHTSHFSIRRYNRRAKRKMKGSKKDKI